MEKILVKWKMRTGDWDFADYNVWEKYDRDLFGKAIEKVREKEKERRERQTVSSVNKRFGKAMRDMKELSNLYLNLAYNEIETDGIK